MAESTSRTVAPESDSQSVLTQEASKAASGIAPDQRGFDVPSGGAAAPILRADYLDRALSDAEELLGYAAEAGIEVDGIHRDAVLRARSSRDGGWSQEMAAKLLSALTRLAALLKPVTAETLRVCQQKELVTDAIRGYRVIAIILAVIIVPFSFASFVTSAISDAIRKDIAVANDLAVKLTTQLDPARTSPQGTPSSARPRAAQLNQTDLTELQQFAATIRAVDGRSRQLNHWLKDTMKDRFVEQRTDLDAFKRTFELPVPLTDPPGAANEKIATYQQVRYFAQSVLETTSVYYGAAATCILPVLYALLGACAYLIRSFEQQVKMRTFAPSGAHSARFVIAGIGGAVVGLFNNFNVSQGASIPPLAIAFLVGYAADVFFSFLEALLQTFTKSRSSPAGAGKEVGA